MTDKQTALLLRQIAGRIRALAAEIEPLIESGESVPVELRIDWSTTQRKTDGSYDVDYTGPTTRLAAVQRVLDLAADLEDEAELLVSADSLVPAS